MKINRELIKPFLLPIAVSTFILLGAFTYAYLALHAVDALLIIHFDGNRGIDFLGTQLDVYGIIAVGFGMLLINSALAWSLYRRSRFLSIIVSYATVYLSLLIFIAVSAIISNN